jgi:uncharacterized membrane protein/predicted DsbA family dithiol-disulfide isomerase
MSAKLILFRVLAILGLMGCVASLGDALLPEPAFCGPSSGCAAVSRSAFGSIAGIPLGAFGVIAFVVFLVVSLFADRSAGKCLGPMALLAGFSGLGFVLIQALVLQRFCRLCLVIDALAMMLAAVELAWRSPRYDSLSPRGRAAWVIVAFLIAGAPLAWRMVSPSPPVPAIVRQQRRPERISVVEVTAFECVHCRRTHAPLAALLKTKGDEIHFVRLVKPLPGHGGGAAARAYWFAAARGKAEPMADLLFNCSDLGPAGCEKLVLQLGLDLTDFRAFLADPATARQIEEMTAALTEVRALPTIWIDNRPLVGGQTKESLEAAYQRASQVSEAHEKRPPQAHRRGCGGTSRRGSLGSKPSATLRVPGEPAQRPRGRSW